MTGANTKLTAAVEAYFADLGRVRASGGATGERSSYGPLANLLNAVGATLKPKVFCVGELADQGAGHPDFGLYAARSGFAPVLALHPIEVGRSGHAVCCVGVRYEPPPPQINTEYMFREASSGLRGLYIHDDRLGPYASAGLAPLTDPQSGKIQTCVSIEWPDKKPVESWLLHAIVIPVPKKLRLTLAGLQRIGLNVAHAIGEAFTEPKTTLDYRFELSRTYAKRIYGFGLSSEGLHRAVCGTVLSRYIGLIEIAGPAGPMLDIVVDSTETNPESAVLSCIKRSGFPETQIKVFEAIEQYLGVVGIS